MEIRGPTHGPVAAEACVYLTIMFRGGQSVRVLQPRPAAEEQLSGFRGRWQHEAQTMPGMRITLRGETKQGGDTIRTELVFSPDDVVAVCIQDQPPMPKEEAWRESLREDE